MARLTWMARIVLFAGTYRIFWKFFNLPRRAKRNVANQYDLTDSLFDQFIDRRRQHSCGCFYKVTDTLADAQITKLARLGAKLCLQPNQQFLDIGCGWGEHANASWEMQLDVSVTGTNAAVSTGLFRLACLNISACAILTVTLPRLRGYWHQMGWRWSIRSGCIITPNAVTAG